MEIGDDFFRTDVIGVAEDHVILDAGDLDLRTPGPPDPSEPPKDSDPPGDKEERRMSLHQKRKGAVQISPLSLSGIRRHCM